MKRSDLEIVDIATYLIQSDGDEVTHRILQLIWLDNGIKTYLLKK